MTGRRRPPRPPREPSVPKGFEDVPELSPEEVERRVDVRGGGSPRAPIERPVRRTPPPRRPERTVARDSLLLIGLVIVGLVAVSVLLPDGPLTGTSSTPPGTQVAAASASPRPTTAGPTGTSVPVVATLDVTAGPTEIPTIGSTATPIPVPTPTARPGETPRPTVKPVSTPKPTAGPSSPTTELLIVEVITIIDSGGTATSSNWTVTVTSAGTASPSSFKGVSFGTYVTLSAGKTYSVTVSGPGGYLKEQSTDCSSATGGLPIGGTTETCTITLDDIQPQVTVITNVDGGTQSSSDWTVTVTGSHVNPDAQFPGSVSGTDVRFDANAAFTITEANPNDTDYTADQSGSCSGSGLSVGATVTCTYTFTYNPPPTVPTGPSVLVLAFIPMLFPRRWRPIRRR